MDGFLSQGSSQEPRSIGNSPAARPTHKRQPSLLPAFEPISSPLQQPASLKRKHGQTQLPRPYYPTPVPTSSTGILPSSPARRTALTRTVSTCSERAPLSSVQTVDLPADGESVILGRSSNSCHVQLPYNRLISRKHVRVWYEAGDVFGPQQRIGIECLGWNGCVVHCDAGVHQLGKNEIYYSKRPYASIILDIHDARVSLAWPRANESAEHSGSESEDGWIGVARGSPCPIPLNHDSFPSSPPPPLQSPISPSPARRNPRLQPTAVLPSPLHSSVKIYEDPESERESQSSPIKANTAAQSFDTVKLESSFVFEPITSFVNRDLDKVEEHDEEDGENEENDPIIHSFGPMGANILNRLNSFTTGGSLASPERPLKRKKPLRDTSNSPQMPAPRNLPGSPMKSSPIKPAPKRQIKESPVKNHIINQLAFSRVHAMPLSTIHSNLPAELRAIAESKEEITNADLKKIIDSTNCLGEIQRAGKDAAGKPLENEYYYLPEKDDNTMRKSAVLSTRGGTGLRSVRKTHKQYYWKKPRV